MTILFQKIVFIKTKKKLTKVAVKSMGDFANATGDAFVKGMK